MLARHCSPCTIGARRPTAKNASIYWGFGARSPVMRVFAEAEASSPLEAIRHAVDDSKLRRVSVRVRAPS